MAFPCIVINLHVNLTLCLHHVNQRKEFRTINHTAVSVMRGLGLGLGLVI